MFTPEEIADHIVALMDGEWITAEADDEVDGRFILKFVHTDNDEANLEVTVTTYEGGKMSQMLTEEEFRIKVERA
jgi:NAD(P)H-flavin reductase